jgi:hypothetical protein
MINFVRVPDELRSRYETWKAETVWGRKQWIARAEEAEEYYYNDVDQTGTTYTSAQTTKIAQNTNIPVSINFLHPVTNQKLALLTQTKPSVKTLSLDGRAKEHAFVLDKMKHGIFYNSNANLEIEGMVKDMLVAGMGHIMVTPVDFYKKGMFNLQVVHVPWDEVILDINSKTRTLDDMEGFFIERAFTVPKALQVYGGILSQLKNENGDPVGIESFTGETWVEQELTDKQDVTTTHWNADDRVIVREYYTKVFTDMYLVKQEGLTRILFAENLGPEEQSMIANPSQVNPDIYIKKTIMMGDFIIWEEILPITNYPLRTTFFEWGGRPYRSYGMIHFTKGMQEAFDKVLQIMLLNGILSNNAGWTAPKGSIPEEDRDKWEQFGANPKVIKEYVPKVLENQVLKPERDQVTALSNFYPMVLDMLKSGIEYSTGVNAVLQGDAKEANVEVFSSLQQYQNAAMMRVKMSTGHINQVMKELGQVLIEYMVANLTPDSFSFFDENGQLNELQIALEAVNDIKTLKFLTVSIPSTALPTQRLAVATELAKIAQSSPDPAERQILTQKALELSDIHEWDEMAKKLDVVKRAQGQLEDLQAAYDRLMETSKQMENKYVNISIENRILKQLASGEKAVEGKFAELETKLKLADELAKAQIKDSSDKEAKRKQNKG